MQPTRFLLPRWCALLAVLVVALAVNVTAPLSSVVSDGRVLAAPVPKPKRKPPVVIDPSVVYSNHPDGKMKGTQPLALLTHLADERLKSIKSAAHTVGGSNVFLVGADDISEAVWWTGSLYGNGGGMEEWYKHHEKKETDAWVVAFLGSTSSSPPVYRIARIEVDAWTIRVVYAHEDNIFQTCDGYPYFVWANLGRLKPGKYQLELVEASESAEEVVLMRKVTVPEQKKD